MEKLGENQRKEMDILQKEETERLIRVQEDKMKEFISNQDKERKRYNDTIKWDVIPFSVCL